MSAQIITQGWGAGFGISITVPLPPFPNVPSLPGVPQIARSLLFPPSGAPALGFAANPDVLWHATQAAPVWGVFDSDGNQVIVPDSVQDFGWRAENRVPNFPIQQGQFATYNRVGLPFETSVMLVKGGDLTSRSVFLAQVDTVIAQANVNLYTVRTPEKSYINVTVTRAEMSRRGKDGAFWFDVELYFTQVNQQPVQYSNTQTPTNNASVPSAIPPVNQGLTNPQIPTSAVQQSALTAVTPPHSG